MNMNEELKKTLMDKLSREQDKYRDWLKGQPPEEILIVYIIDCRNKRQYPHCF